MTRPKASRILMRAQPGSLTAAYCAGALLIVLLTLGACATAPDDGPPATVSAPAVPRDAVPRREPMSRYGNGPVYEVFGQRYEVLATSQGYEERGVASWYGRKFHGRPTASRERYDMYEMTAAHKSLPLPTYVEVRNLRNGKRVVVRVNDRGPFVDNRIIDLSYAAALKLDMVRDGTSLVEVRAINLDAPRRADPPERATAAAAAPPAAQPRARRVYVQVGAYGDRANAARRHRMLMDNGFRSAFVHEEQAADTALYRVRVGPIDGVKEYDAIVDRLTRIGIDETHLVTD